MILQFTTLCHNFSYDHDQLPGVTRLVWRLEESRKGLPDCVREVQFCHLQVPLYTYT